MTDYVRIPIRADEHKRLVTLQTELTGKIDSYLTRPSLSDVIKELLNQQEIKAMKTYTNIDERYGEQTQATISDYQSLNPNGKFVEIHGEIREILSDIPGDYEVVAIEQEIIDTQKERDQLLSNFSKTA